MMDFGMIALFGMLICVGFLSGYSIGMKSGYKIGWKDGYNAGEINGAHDTRNDIYA